MQDMHDGCVVQLGIGGMPNAVGMLIAQSDLKDLGCHTEMLVDAYVHMFNAGKMSGARKNLDPGKIVYTFATGTRCFTIFSMTIPGAPPYPVNYTNNPDVASLNDNLIAINNAIEVDLYGQVCAESSGIRQISGTGGSSTSSWPRTNPAGERPSSACHRVTRPKRERSIRGSSPRCRSGGIATDPRSIAHIIVTEYGKLNLKGKTLAEGGGPHQYCSPRYPRRADQGGRSAGHLEALQQAPGRNDRAERFLPV